MTPAEIKKHLTNVYTAILFPERLLQSVRTTTYNNDIVKASLLLLGTLTLVIFLIATFNISAIRSALKATYEYFPYMKPKTPELLPWNRLVFPFIFLAATAVNLLLRRIALFISSLQVSFPSLVSAHLLGSMPFYLFAGISSIYENLWPFQPNPTMSVNKVYFIVFIPFMILTMFLEIRCMKLFFQGTLPITTGRAIFLSVSNILLFILFLGILLLGYFVFLLINAT